MSSEETQSPVKEPAEAAVDAEKQPPAGPKKKPSLLRRLGFGIGMFASVSGAVFIITKVREAMTRMQIAQLQCQANFETAIQQRDKAIGNTQKAIERIQTLIGIVEKHQEQAAQMGAELRETTKLLRGYSRALEERKRQLRTAHFITEYSVCVDLAVAVHELLPTSKSPVTGGELLDCAKLEKAAGTLKEMRTACESAEKRMRDCGLKGERKGNALIGIRGAIEAHDGLKELCAPLPPAEPDPFDLPPPVPMQRFRHAPAAAPVPAPAPPSHARPR